MIQERGSDPVEQLMYDNLLTFVRRFGPVGARAKPSKETLRQARILYLEQFDQRLLWLERNSTMLRSPDHRAALRSMRES